eukprot:CAMPEP_0119056682 /NCGR_PEP_ID=MMETSP1178-20130426/1287_1 /TAXON_ID=33656 /ORGANISM="unid sp, Strain CCMP2000" /LENGTH=103 /DNA_ID=CAMNT_0007037431 /DNA_START=192 /DNA_END=504 /DNA_ORIENTATION=+
MRMPNESAAPPVHLDKDAPSKQGTVENINKKSATDGALPSKLYGLAEARIAEQRVSLVLPGSVQKHCLLARLEHVEHPTATHADMIGVLAVVRGRPANVKCGG